MWLIQIEQKFVTRDNSLVTNVKDAEFFLSEHSAKRFIELNNLTNYKIVSFKEVIRRENR